MQNKWREIEDNEDLKREFRGYKRGLVRFGPAGWCFAPGTAEMVSKYQVCKACVVDLDSFSRFSVISDKLHIFMLFRVSTFGRMTCGL